MAFGITLCRCEVDDLGLLLSSNDLGKRAIRVGLEPTARELCLSKSRRHIVGRDDAQCAPFMQIEVAKFRLAKPRRVRQHGLEHWLQFARRARNNTQHLGSCGLLLQRFAQFVQQPDVFDRDHGLAREAGDKRDLLVGE